LRPTDAPLDCNGTRSPTTMPRPQSSPSLYPTGKEPPLTIGGCLLPKPNIFLSKDRAFEQGHLPPGEAAVHAARTRLRPILMTSFSFILGVAPLAVATGAAQR
jgi:hypothetical protein